MNPDSEEGTTKVTKGTKIEEITGLRAYQKRSWLENPTNPLFFVKFSVFRGWNGASRGAGAGRLGTGCPPGGLEQVVPATIVDFWIFEQEHAEGAELEGFSSGSLAGIRPFGLEQVVPATWGAGLSGIGRNEKGSGNALIEGCEAETVTVRQSSKVGIRATGCRLAPFRPWRG